MLPCPGVHLDPLGHVRCDPRHIGGDHGGKRRLAGFRLGNS